MSYVAEISLDGSDGVVIKFDYSQDMVDALKLLVPKGCRRYTPRSKTWWVNQHHLDEVTRKFTSYGYEVVVNVGSTRGEVDPWFELFEAIEPELARKLFRVLAMTLHPDKGGDPKMMRDINIAWDKVQDQRHE